MGLDFKRWLREKLGGGVEKVTTQAITGEDLWSASAEIFVREMAFQSCADYLGKALAKCRFRTFWDGEEQKGPEYYLWNYSPNKNQSATAFRRKLVEKLYRDNEALVIEHGGQLLIADSFTRRPYALVDDVFSQVTVGDFDFRKTFVQSEVLYFTLGEKPMQPLVSGLCEAYRKLLDYTISSYQKSRGTKAALKLGTVPVGKTEEMQKLSDLYNKNFRSFAQAENAVLVLYDGMEYKPQEHPTYSNEGTRDIRAMINDIFDFNARAFGIHPAVLSGNVAGSSDAVEQTIADAVDPLAKLLETEITRKRYGAAKVEKGCCLTVDTKSVRHIDLVNAPSSLEKLVSSGTYCVNEIRIAMGEPIINEPWAWKHFLTKNYSEILEAIEAWKGGETE